MPFRMLRCAGLAALGLSMLTLAARAQQAPKAFPPPPQAAESPDPDARGIYATPEVLPEFPGGPTALQRYLKENLQYPKAALQNRVEGMVYVRFVIDSAGAVTEPQLKQPLDPTCDAEALRLVREMPRWQPGRQGKRAVPTYATLPVRFHIEGPLR